MRTPGDGPGQVGALLRRHRKAAGLSQKELADAAGLSPRGISDLERGVRRRPYPATIRRLVAALGLGRAGRAELLLAVAAEDVQGSASRSSQRTSRRSRQCRRLDTRERLTYDARQAREG
jgi:transcriptional regulator with XRE-family HTH domain